VLHPADVADGARATRHFFLIYLAAGFVLYFIYGMWNSKLGRGITVTGHEQPNPTQPNQ
jgi:hypothetical protein